MKINSSSVKAICFVLCLASCNETPLTEVKQQEEEMGITPFGLIPKSKIFLVEEGFITKVENNRLLKIELKTGRIVKDLGEVKPNDKDHSGARISGLSGPLILHQNDVLRVNNSAAPNNDFYSTFASNIVVPPAPAQNTETLFLGNRMVIFDQYDSWQGELVSALQYGPSSAGGGWFWSVCNWQIIGNNMATHDTPTQTTTGTAISIAITWTGTQYQQVIGSNTRFYQPGSQILTKSNISLFLAGSPKLTGSYPTVFSANLTGVNVVRKFYNTFTYPPVVWGGTTSSSKGEHVKVVSTSSPNGQVDLCFYGTPSGLFYPNNSVYPLTLTWNGTYGAQGYDISYYIQDHYGNYTYYNSTSTASPFTFPFTITTCRGCDLFTKVRAKYANGVVSDWSATFNAMLP